MKKIIPVILSGGIGSRLWPVSRKQRPKPFVWIEKNASLLGNTFRRLSCLGIEDVVSVSNNEYKFANDKEVSDVQGFSFNHHQILEPFGRNTAGAIAIASLFIEEKFGKDAIMLVLPSDHIIKDTKGFARTINKAMNLATNNLVTIGVKAVLPNTGYGYIKAGDKLGDGYNVDSFVEKPTLDFAKKYVEAGDYYWNAGMFMFTASTYLNALAKHCPEVLKVAKMIEMSSDDNLVLDAEVFSSMPDISIDYAVMEKADNVVVVPADFDWNDLGTWDSVAEVLLKDENGNSVRGDTLLTDTQNTTVFSTSNDKLIATLGVDNLTIVETRDVVLVANNNNLQDVKKIVDTLKKNKSSLVDVHRTEYRPWGTFTILDEGNGYKVKQILVYPHKKLSFQSHKHRSEHWIIVSGQAVIQNENDFKTLNPNQSTYISQGNKHRLINETDCPVIMIEVQTGTYLGEDDIERFEDDFSRV